MILVHIYHSTKSSGVASNLAKKAIPIVTEMFNSPNDGDEATLGPRDVVVAGPFELASKSDPDILVIVWAKEFELLKEEIEARTQSLAKALREIVPEMLGFSVQVFLTGGTICVQPSRKHPPFPRSGMPN